MTQPAAEQPRRLKLDELTSDALDQLYNERDRLRARVEDWRTSTGAGLRLIDELRAERDALAAGVPLVCSDERHKTKMFALDIARTAAEKRAERAESERDGVYRERAHLVALLAALYPSHIGHTDPSAPDWAVVIVETPSGQLSWHIAASDMWLFGHVRSTDRVCRGWDGHTTEHKYERVRDLTLTTDPLPIRAALDEHQEQP
ncbi:hypothetical protein [Streptomyces sp. NPDC059071]|uniref:WDGH domain-containing protein n=1 Tax=unclassified Streptomyces TaxID=2593676 RepID=UPI003654199C